MTLPDTRMLRCTSCQLRITYDSPAAEPLEGTASLDVMRGWCPTCERDRLWLRTDVTGRKPAGKGPTDDRP